MIVQMQEMKIRGLLISVKISRMVSMVKSNSKTFEASDDSQNDKSVNPNDQLYLYCCYCCKNEKKWTYMGGYSNGKGRNSGPQTTTWLLGTYHFW